MEREADGDEKMNTTNNQNEIEKVSRILNSIPEERHNNIEYSVLQIYLNSLGVKDE